MTELESFAHRENPASEAGDETKNLDNGPCPEHPLGNDLFYVLRNAYRP